MTIDAAATRNAATMHQPRGTAGRIVLDAIARFPDRPAVSDGTTSWSYAELGTVIGRYIALFRELGIRKGDGISVLSTNRIEPWAVLCAANLMGLRYTPLHPLAAVNAQVDVLADAQVRALIVEADHFAIDAAVIAAQVPGLDVLMSLGALDGAVDLAQRAAALAPAPLIDEAAPDDIAWLGYTGGTTGKSKGVMTTHRGRAAVAMIQAAEYGWPSQPRYLVTTPMTHAGGTVMYAAMFLGGYTRFMRGFDGEQVCRVVAAERINTIFLVPTLVNKLIELGEERARTDLATLELVIYGASPMDPGRLRRGLELFGPIFVQLYGQSEAPHCISTLRKGDHDLAHPHRLASCGRPTLAVDVKLLDADLREVPTGEVGEICVRGPIVMNGYWQQPELTAQTIAGGWLHTGDLARADEDGFLYIVDRSKDMIISGGFNIYPREVEDALLEHPAVSQAAVIGVPDDRWGEAVMAFVIAADGAQIDAAELQRLVKDRRGGPWAPKAVSVVREFPYTGLGKLDRVALRAPFWTERERRV